MLYIVNKKYKGDTMNHKGTKRIETENLILRRFEISDAEAMYKNWANDDEVTKYLTWASHSSVEVSKDILNIWIDDYIDGVDDGVWIDSGRDVREIKAWMEMPELPEEST